MNIYAGAAMAATMYQPRYRNSWALIVGINTYQNGPPLSYACNDADALAAAVVDKLDFSPDHLIVLKDGMATKQAILDAFDGFRTKASDPDDRVLVFFAGHGMTVEGHRGPVGYLVPADGDPRKLSSLIRWDDLTRTGDLIPAKHILFIMDACYSGLALQRALLPGTQRFLTDMLQRFARQVITAGKADETVADGGGPQGENSIFTGCLLEGLYGAAVDVNGVLTANGLMHYVYQRVSQDSQSQQTPHYGHIEGDGDLVLLTPNGEHLGYEGWPDFLVETVVEVPEPTSNFPVATVKPSFAESNGYGDPTYPGFGRNDWSERLGEHRHNRENWLTETSKAFSWLSLIVEPTANQLISIDVVEIAQSRQLNLSGDKPYERFRVPLQSRTTMDSVVFFDLMDEDSKLWDRYLRIDKKGNIEYADSSRRIFGEYDGIRYFAYVQAIGTIWQFMFLVRNLLAKAGYAAGVRVLVNFVGTRGSILADFSGEAGKGGKKWLSPFKSDEIGRRLNLSELTCSDPNLQLQYNLVIGNLNEAESRKIIEDVACQLGQAYNHQGSLRCFNYNTDVFPWQQYFQGR
jgi:hypothetical protein